MEVYLFSLMVVLLVFTGATGGLGLLIYFGTPKRRPSDASHLNLPPPGNFQDTIEKIAVLGFHRLGEIYTRMPLSMSPGPTWIFTDGPMTTQAEIVEITPGVFFTSIFYDGSVVETGFPQGENISTTVFLSQTVTTSIDDAYHQHQLSLQEFDKDHGSPQPTQTMDDYLHWDGINRSRHARRKMRRVFIIDLIQVLALLYGIVVSMIVWLLWQRHASVPEWVTDWDRGLFLLLAPAFAASILSTLVGFIGGRQSRKRAKIKGRWIDNS
jgi:hypothetical protein